MTASLKKLLLLTWLAAGSFTPGWAQTFTCGTLPAPIPFAQWDWTIPTSHPNYCRNWTLNRLSTGIKNVNAPWERATTTAFQEMGYDRDFTREKGWELLRMDFGHQAAIQIPYFILYNKYTSMVRAFFYVDVSQGTFINGALVSMTNSAIGGASIPAVTTIANPLLQSSDSYLQNQAGSAEVMTYVGKVSGISCWVEGEFTLGFDPQIGSAAYAGSTLQFELQGITSSDVKLNGSMSWKTDAQEGYGVTGKKSDVVTDVKQPVNGDPKTGVKKFLAAGQKVLGKVNKDDVGKFLDKAAERAKSAKDLFAPGSTASSTKLKVADAVIKLAGEGSKLPGTIKKIAAIAGSVNIAFGVLGSVVGALWPDEADTPQAPPFIPTVSTGTLDIKGTITTTYPLATVLVQIPGTQHRGTGGTQPYYDCAPGLFTIKNTPVLNRMYWSSGDIMQLQGIEFYASYQADNELVPAFNKGAGLKLVSAQAAIVTEEPLPLPTRFLNPRIPDGEVVYADSNKVQYQTDYVDLSCFKNLAFTTNNLFGRERVFVRVKAVLERQDVVGGPPIFFVQDYSVQFHDSNPTPSQPFSNIPMNLPAPYLQNQYPQEGVNRAPLMFSFGWFNNQFSFPRLSGTFIGTNDPGSAPGATMTFDHPNTALPTYLIATEGLTFGEGFSVTNGTNFVASTEILAYHNNQCSGSLMVDPMVTPCTYNSIAERGTPVLATAADEKPAAGSYGPKLSIFPNPSAGDITVVTELKGEKASLGVYDSFGRLVKTISDLPTGKIQRKISLTGQAPGIYIVRLQTAERSVTQKVVLQ